MSRPDLTGQRFGRLLVVADEPRTYDWMYACRCDCGNQSVAAGKNLRQGKSASCGCLTQERAIQARRDSRIESPSYNAVHRRLRRDVGPASGYECPCGERASDWAYDHSDPDELIDEESDGPFSLKPDAYQPLCRRCHCRFDSTFTRGPNLHRPSDHEITLVLTSQEVPF